MRIKILNEAGYEEAIYGLSLSYNVDDLDKIKQVANKLAHREGGHNKFLESMMLWIDIDAPRNWWSQADTYRIGVTKQSESTMHTLLKRELTSADFENPINPLVLDTVNMLIRNKEFEMAKDHLPEGFLQQRVVCTSYKVLRNIIQQRHAHKLITWHKFIDKIYSQVKYPNFLPIRG